MITRPAGDHSPQHAAQNPPDHAPPGEDLTAEFVRRAQVGDAHAFETLVHTLHQPLLAVVRRRIRNPDDAEDVLQEVWLRIARHLDNMREPARFRAWASSIARHCCIDFLRARRVERLRSVYNDTDILDTVRDTTQQSPDAALLASEASAELGSALARLSAQDRALLELREVYEIPYAEVAHRLNITVNAAQVRVFRARRRLQVLLTEAIEQIGCAVPQDELRALTLGQTRPAQAEMLWRHVATCAHCEYRLRLLKKTGATGKSGAA